jgi:two-component system, chemotaxis family, chemotaxis protein CheY
MPTVTTPVLDAPASPPAGRPLHILYADDMPELRSLVSDVFVREGHAVETVGDGDKALEQLRHSVSPFDLLITDHHMPGISGLDLVRQTRRLPYSGKIVVFSSELSETVKDEYRGLAVDAILTKPIFPLTFRTVLEQLFAKDDHAATEPAAAPFPEPRR